MRGLRLVGVLGVAEVVILLSIVCSGFAALARGRLMSDSKNVDNAFAAEDGDGYDNGEAQGYSTALLWAVCKRKRWENANDVAGE